MRAIADIYNHVTDKLHQWLSIPEYLHNVQIDAYASHSHRNKCLLQRCLTSTVFVLDSEGIRFHNEIIMCCYVCYMLKYALKSVVKQ